jgi:hypothetical protein
MLHKLLEAKKIAGILSLEFNVPNYRILLKKTAFPNLEVLYKCGRLFPRCTLKLGFKSMNERRFTSKFERDTCPFCGQGTW